MLLVYSCVLAPGSGALYGDRAQPWARGTAPGPKPDVQPSEPGVTSGATLFGSRVSMTVIVSYIWHCRMLDARMSTHKICFRKKVLCLSDGFARL